jgi:hypothetical protein
MSERNLRSFEGYLDSHDATAQLLYQNPDLITDRSFVRQQETFDNWLQNHPDAARAERADPDRYLWRERSTTAPDFVPQLLGLRR